MLYELICVVRPRNVNEVKELCRATGQIVLDQRGVVRSIANWGTYQLTNPIRKHQERYLEGHHFVMRFDCAPATQAAIKKMLNVDPRMLRYGIVKLGDGTLKGTSEYGPIRWSRKSQLDTF